MPDKFERAWVKLEMWRSMFAIFSASPIVLDEAKFDDDNASELVHFGVIGASSNSSTAVGSTGLLTQSQSMSQGND